MGSATGIEITGDTLRCVVLAGSAKAPRLKKAFCESITPADGEENSNGGAAERVKDLLKEKGVPTGNVVLALDGRQVYCREVVVPFLRADQIQKTIKFEAEEFMPAAPVESMVVDHYKVAEIDGKSRVLVCGVQKNVVSEILEFCRNSDFAPRVLDLDSACLANVGFDAGAFQAPQAEKTDADEDLPVHASCIALDISPGIVRLVLIEDGRLRRARSFKISIDPQSPSPEALNKIAREVKRTEASCSIIAPVSTVYLTGPAYTINIEAMLRQVLGLEVKTLNIQSITKSEGQEDLRNMQEAGSVALGAALKGLGVDNIAFDFRKEEFAFRKAFDELKAGFACTACLVFFMAFMLAYTFNLRLSQNRYAMEKLREDAKQAFLKLLPGESLKSYKTPLILGALKDTLERRKEGRVSGKVPEIIPALDIFKDFGEAVKRANVKFRLLECSINQNSVRIRGVIEEELEGDRIEREIINQSKYLVFDGSGTDSVKGQLELNLRCKVKNPR